MKNFIIIFTLFFTYNLTYSQGLLAPTKEDFMELEKAEMDVDGFVEEDLPASYSLRKYAPTPKEQEGATCVGWSLSYASMSIMYNVITETTDPTIKNLTAFDPYYIYSLIKTIDKDNSCEEGLIIPRGIAATLDYGSKKYYLPNPPDFIENDKEIWCDDRWNMGSLENFALYNSKPYKPKEFYYLTNNDGKYGYLNYLKYLISIENKPIIIGFDLRDSFDNIEDNGLWNPDLNDEQTEGHAMTVIGYDDNKFGGSIEIMNSWGTEFGDEGFLWVPYDKFYSLIEEKQIEDDEGTLLTNAYILEYDESIYNNDNPIFLSDNTLWVEFDNNEIYDGNFYNSSNYSPKSWNSSSTLSGFGQYIFENKDVYTGQFKNDLMDGTGFYYDYYNNIMYIVTHNEGELVSEEELGFSKESEMNTDRLTEYLSKNFKNIESESSEEPDIRSIRRRSKNIN